MSRGHRTNTATAKRLIYAVLLGLAIAVLLVSLGQGRYALLAGWDTVAVVYVGITLAIVLRFGADETREHARRENPGRAVADALLLITSVASIAAVGLLILLANKAQGVEKAVDIGLGLVSVVVSWGVVHTIYLLKYARLYYGDPEGGIDFNEHTSPRYTDFAYMAFTIGMTFQVSDTALKTKNIRTTVLKQALLAYLFGTVIIATTINTLASLSN